MQWWFITVQWPAIASWQWPVERITEADPLTIAWEVAEELIYNSMVIWHLKQIGKVKNLNKWVPHELTANQKNSSFWNVIFSYYMQQQQTVSWIVICNEKWILQLATTSSVDGLRRSSNALPKAKLVQKKKKGHSYCLAVCCFSDLLPISKSQRNYYIWEVCSTNQWDAPKTAMPSASIG